MTALALRPFAPFTSGETYRSLLYQGANLVLGALAFTLLVAGWCITVCFAITPLVVPLLIGLRVGVGSLAQAQAYLVRNLLGAEACPSVLPSGKGFWSRGFAALRDRAFWRQQAHLLVVWPIALIPLTLLTWAMELITLPIWYRWADSSDVIGFLSIDSFGEALPVALVGLGLLLVTVNVLGPLASFSRWLASRLLGGEGEAVMRSRAEVRARRLRALTINAMVSAAIVLTLIVVWALTTPDGYFWPIWPVLGLSLVVAIPGWVVLVLERPEISRLTLGSQALAIQIGVSAVFLGFLVAVWAVTTNGYFWPVWPALGLALAAVVHAAVIYGQREHRIRRLEESRAGAVEVQESELRRIERDLHDGAQARLVALGMSLGRAEQALEDDPEAVRDLLADARRGAGEALEELRVLARGIRPPILTDRGLEPAISALIARTPVPVALSVDDSDRYPAAVETAAYFTVAEALANAIKHANAERIDIRVRSADGSLLAEVVDDGAGGADPSGPGLTGLRQRAEALDGRLRVVSPAGGPTTVTVELPCE
jgi:signal transduction histidine kinase